MLPLSFIVKSSRREVGLGSWSGPEHAIGPFTPGKAAWALGAPRDATTRSASNTATATTTATTPRRRSRPSVGPKGRRERDVARLVGKFIVPFFARSPRW